MLLQPHSLRVLSLLLLLLHEQQPNQSALQTQLIVLLYNAHSEAQWWYDDQPQPQMTTFS
jgi:hypothetical protein